MAPNQSLLFDFEDPSPRFEFSDSKPRLGAARNKKRIGGVKSASITKPKVVPKRGEHIRSPSHASFSSAAMSEFSFDRVTVGTAETPSSAASSNVSWGFADSEFANGFKASLSEAYSETGNADAFGSFNRLDVGNTAFPLTGTGNDSMSMSAMSSVSGCIDERVRRQDKVTTDERAKGPKQDNTKKTVKPISIDGMKNGYDKFRTRRQQQGGGKSVMKSLIDDAQMFGMLLCGIDSADTISSKKERRQEKVKEDFLGRVISCKCYEYDFKDKSK